MRNGARQTRRRSIFRGEYRDVIHFFFQLCFDRNLCSSPDERADRNVYTSTGLPLNLIPLDPVIISIDAIFLPVRAYS